MGSLLLCSCARLTALAKPVKHLESFGYLLNLIVIPVPLNEFLPPSCTDVLGRQPVRFEKRWASTQVAGTSPGGRGIKLRSAFPSVAAPIASMKSVSCTELDLPMFTTRHVVVERAYPTFRILNRQRKSLNQSDFRRDNVTYPLTQIDSKIG